MKQAKRDLAIQNPALWQGRVSNKLKKMGLLVSPGGVFSIWLQLDLNTMKIVRKAFEAKVAQDGMVLTEDQLAAIEKITLRSESSIPFTWLYTWRIAGHRRTL